MSNSQHNPTPAPLHAVRRGLASRLMLLLAMLGLVAGAPFAAAQQYAGQGCIATMENRSAFVDADGIYTISNIPAVLGQYPVHVVCPQADGTLLTATSPYYNLQGLTTLIFPQFQLGPPGPELQTLVLHSIGGSLTALGAQVHLETQGVLSDGNVYNKSTLANGTTYLTSNPAVATVDTNGLVTATGPGSVTITANNDGLSSTILLISFSQLDSDGDGMPDASEIANGLNPYDPTDAGLDPDGDGLTNLQEYQLGTNPHVFDTDGDGLSDGQEIALGTNPLVADTDGDGLTDGQEVAVGSNPLNPDSDGDGIPDGIELKIGTNPLVADVTTTVTGYVTDGFGSPHPGASVVLFTYFTTLADTTGSFTLLHVPVTLGSLIVSAQAIVGTSVYSGSSQTTVPIGNGTTNVGTITLGPNSGQVFGRIFTPDGKPDPGVQVTVVNGVNSRTAVTDGSGLYAVGGFSAGPVTVAALDPATSLRGFANGTLSGTAPLTLNVTLGPFGAVSGTVTNAAGANVGAGVAVNISGALGGSTTTNTLGQYTFSFVPLGAVTMDATDANGNHGRASGIITATSQTITANVQYLGRGTVTGVVSDGSGTPVAGAVVRLSNNGLFSQYPSTTTNNIGQYTFTNIFVGPLNLSASSAATSTGGTATASIITDGQTVTANISLQATGSISGTVFRANGTTPVSGATVAVNGTALTATTTANGTFNVGNLPLGTYNLYATDIATIDRARKSSPLPPPARPPPSLSPWSASAPSMSRSSTEPETPAPTPRSR